jgi:hypothetical protein
VVLDLRDVAAVIFTSGFRPDYTRWVRFPAFDVMGFPLTRGGRSTVVPGLSCATVRPLRRDRLCGLVQEYLLVA